MDMRDKLAVPAGWNGLGGSAIGAAALPKGPLPITSRLAALQAGLDDILNGLMSVDSRLRSPRPMEAAGEAKADSANSANVELALDRIERRTSQIASLLSELSQSV